MKIWNSVHVYHVHAEKAPVSAKARIVWIKTILVHSVKIKRVSDIVSKSHEMIAKLNYNRINLTAFKPQFPPSRVSKMLL